MQLKFEEPYLGRGRGGGGAGVLTSIGCLRRERGRRHRGRAWGGVEVGGSVRGGVRGSVEVGGGGGVESGVGGGVEGVRRARGDRRATAAARAEEFDLGEVAVGKDERGG